jgi:hypothetical protein
MGDNIDDQQSADLSVAKVEYPPVAKCRLGRPPRFLPGQYTITAAYRLSDETFQTGPPILTRHILGYLGYQRDESGIEDARGSQPRREGRHASTREFM